MDDEAIHRLDEHAREASAGVLRQDPSRHQQDGVRAHRGRGERQRAGHELRRGVEHEAGRLYVDAHQQTSTPGLYAAGDVVRGLNQISTAEGEGAIAATDVHNALREGR